MIIGPSTAALFSPQIALAMIVLLEAFSTIPLAWKNRKQVSWPEVIPILIGFMCLTPFGIWLLKSGDPTALRWFISISILIVVTILWSGWKYTGPRNAPVSFSFGALGGFMGASAALPGPSVLVYWLASTLKAAQVRANMIWYLFLTDLIILIGYVFGDVFSFVSAQLAIITAPAYMIGIWIGSKLFSTASESAYTTVAYVMILVAAITSLPILDSIIRE